MKSASISAAVACAILIVSAQGVSAAAPAPAATPPVQMIPGLAIANIDAIVGNSNAFKRAVEQRRTAYKSQIDAAEARRKQINAQIQPLVEKFNRERQAAAADQASLQQQAQAIQQLQQSGQQELQRMLAPVGLSEAYVDEQIRATLDPAIKAAMAKKGVSFVVTPQNVLAFNDAYNLSPDILAELNALLPSAQVTPPAGWEPRAAREAKAAQAQAQATPPKSGK